MNQINPITFECPACNQPYSQYQQPKVLPCGHSLCSVCLGQAGYYLNCSYCHTRYDQSALSYAPINMLYFQMIQKMNEYMKKRDWENPQKNQIESTQMKRDPIFRIEEQCLYTFCQRRRYERDGVSELFCSQECKKNHDLLQAQ